MNKDNQAIVARALFCRPAIRISQIQGDKGSPAKFLRLVALSLIVTISFFLKISSLSGWYGNPRLNRTVTIAIRGWTQSCSNLAGRWLIAGCLVNASQPGHELIILARPLAKCVVAKDDSHIAGNRVNGNR